jgi:2-polyprenyl-3-methyl-5-hydroxy-6-metoxy-1,4-benzoquinol methylase
MVYASPIEPGWASGLNYQQLAVPFYLSADKLQGDYSPVRFQRELRLFRKFCSQGKVLDVGCSTGAFLFQLHTRFPGEYDAIGNDVAGPALDYAEQKGIRVLRGSFLAEKFGRTGFSAVTFWAVLEHLANPLEFLKRAEEILAPGGVCFVLVPNFESLAVRLLGGRYRYIFPQHINYFTRNTLGRLVGEACNLQVIYSGGSHFNPLVIWQDRRGRGEFVEDADRARLLKRTTAYKTSVALAPLRLALRFGESVLGLLNLADNLVLVLRKTP